MTPIEEIQKKAEELREKYKEDLKAFDKEMQKRQDRLTTFYITLAVVAMIALWQIFKIIENGNLPN